MGRVHDAYFARIDAGELHHDAAQEAVLDELERVRLALENPPAPPKKGLFRKARPLEPPKGLYMWGGVGRGKSMLMDLLVDLVEAPKRRAHFHAFMQWVHAEIAEARETGVDDAIQPVAEALAADVRFLAFDEMQISDITDAMIVGRLFEALFAAGVTVVTTSNRPPDDLYRDGLNRQLFLPFIAMMKNKLTVWELVSETDYRQTVLAGSPSYFTPADAEARARIRAIWADFTGGKAEPIVLRVKGHDLHIPEFHNGVARAKFHDLCGRALGAADYLALAEVARVLILEDIPLLGRSNYNEAKRFVTLIDALYEGRVHLICTAAAAPEMLYVEGEGVFEFERTASRLHEMQGMEWAAASA